MTLDALIMLAGAFVAVLPFLGLPNSWDTVLLFLAGVAVTGLGIVVRRRLPARLDEASAKRAGKVGAGSAPHGGGTQAFVENLPRESTHDSR